MNRLFGCSVPVIVSVIFISLLCGNVLAQDGASDAAPPAETERPGGQVDPLPANPPPPEAASASPRIAATGEGAQGTDSCGNPPGTLYVEGQRCEKYERGEGPYITFKTPWETWLTVMSISFAAVLMIVYAIIYCFSRREIDETFNRYYVILAVIGSAVFVLTAGYSDQQAAPLYGLFGTLVGYLFGRSQAEAKPAQASAGAQQPASNQTAAGAQDGGNG